MIRTSVLALALLLCSYSSVRAAPGPYFSWPRSDYPKHSNIAYANHVNGMQADCSINFDCTTGGSLNHSHEQDYWHRIDGQVQAAETPTHHGLIDWGATLQSYETADYATGVFEDLIATTTITNVEAYRFHSAPPPIVPEGVAVIKLKLYGPVNSITILAAQLGPTEAEIGAAYNNHDRVLVQRFLSKQLQEAVNQMMTQVAP